MATVKCLVTNILQNIFFCVKKLWFGTRLSKWWHNFSLKPKKKKIVLDHVIIFSQSPYSMDKS